MVGHALTNGATESLGNSVAEFEYLRWDVSHSVEVNENINLGYSQDQGYS